MDRVWGALYGDRCFCFDRWFFNCARRSRCRTHHHSRPVGYFQQNRSRCNSGSVGRSLGSGRGGSEITESGDERRAFASAQTIATCRASSSRDLARARGWSPGTGLCGPARGRGSTTIERRPGGCNRAIGGSSDSATGPGARAYPVSRTIPLCDSERIGRNGAAFGYGTATGSYTQGRTQGDRDYADQECVGCIASTTPRCRKTQSEHSTSGCWIQAAYPPADSNKVSVAMYLWAAARIGLLQTLA